MSNGFKLDHFLAYDIDPVPANHEAGFQGQFDQEPVPGNLVVIEMFSNPVSKNGEDIIDKSAHHAWYRLYTEPDPNRVVEFENQFGFQKVAIGRAFFALVPAHKIERGSEPPARLDHFKLYQVLRGHRPNVRTVQLTDQFGEQETPVGSPIFFGVPAAKIRGGQREPIENESDHLVFYKVNAQTLNETREVEDQFDRYKISTNHSILLGVPSKKVDWAET